MTESAKQVKVDAILRRIRGPQVVGRSFPRRSVKDLVPVKNAKIDSTAMISEDRD